jgi:hypothetical protein
MTEITLRLDGAQQVTASMRASSREVRTKMDKLVRHNGALLRTKVLGKASGRPGPNVITGDYRRSWQHKHTGGGGGSSRSEVGTNAVQARRLEYGFAGADSLGRVYNQPPYPHARPAFDEQAPEFIRGGEALLAELIR